MNQRPAGSPATRINEVLSEHSQRSDTAPVTRHPKHFVCLSSLGRVPLLIDRISRAPDIIAMTTSCSLQGAILGSFRLKYPAKGWSASGTIVAKTETC